MSGRPASRSVPWPCQPWPGSHGLTAIGEDDDHGASEQPGHAPHRTAAASSRRRSRATGPAPPTPPPSPTWPGPAGPTPGASRPRPASTRIPSNDFSLYDQVLDTTCLVGAVPDRFAGRPGPSTSTPISPWPGARPTEASGTTRVVAPLEMTKWFDTNYHYLVPELGPGTAFALSSTKPVDEFTEALALGLVTRPVLLGPVTYLLLSKSDVPGFSPWSSCPVCSAVYDAGSSTTWPRPGPAGCSSTSPAWAPISTTTPARPSTSPTGTWPAAPSSCCWPPTSAASAPTWTWPPRSPVAGLHVDLVRHPDQLPALLDHLDADTVLSAGVVDGRNVWRTDLTADPRPPGPGPGAPG